MLKIQDVIDDQKCFEEVRKLRWPENIQCPHCNCSEVVKDGHDEKQRDRQRYECKNCHRRFDDLTNTVFAGHHQPLKIWIIVLYLMGLNISNKQISKEIDLCETNVQKMTTTFREGVVTRQPEPLLKGEIEFDEVYLVAGHKGLPEEVKKRVEKVEEEGYEVPEEEVH